MHCTRQDKDGGLKECGAHLPPWIHQKCIYIWNDSHWKQKTSRTRIQSRTYERQIHNQIERGGKWLDQDLPVPLGGDWGENYDYMGRDSPWGVSTSSYRLDPLRLGVLQRRMCFGRLEDCWDRWKGCRKPGLTAWYWICCSHAQEKGSDVGYWGNQVLRRSLGKEAAVIVGT